MIATVRETCPPTHRIASHRPSRADRMPVDPVLVAEYMAGVDRAIAANRDRERRDQELDRLAAGLRRRDR